jgi:hypothetical protein
MRDKKRPRYPAEGIAMSLNRLLFTDNAAMQSLLEHGAAASEGLIRALNGDHAYAEDGTKIVTLHNVLNYILDENAMGVLYASTTSTCTRCYRVHPNPKIPNEPCDCGGIYVVTSVTGFIPAELREPKVPEKVQGPPLFYALAELLLKKYTPPYAPSVNIMKVASVLQALLNLFIVHGDIDDDTYLVEVLQKEDSVFYRLLTKSEAEEMGAKLASGQSAYVVPEA